MVRSPTDERNESGGSRSDEYGGAGASSPEFANEPAKRDDTGEAAPIPGQVLRRERWFLVLLAAALIVSGVFGWMTVPSNDQLLSRATSHGDIETRIEAMNSLVLRGYWHDLPPRDLEVFLGSAPAEMRRFIEDAHGGLLKRQ